MPSQLNKTYFFLIALLMFPAFGLTQEALNLEFDVREKPYQANLAILPIEGLESVPWYSERSFNSVITNAIRNTPGVGKVFNLDVIAHNQSGGSGYSWRRRNLESRHYLIRIYVEGGGILPYYTGNEAMRFVSFQISLVNIATSQVEKVFRFHCDSNRFLHEAKRRKKGEYPKMNIHSWSISQEIYYQVRKEMERFFYNMEPINELVMDGKDKGFFTKWRGAKDKDLQELVYVIAIRSTMDTPGGPVHQYISLGSARHFPEKSQPGKPYYRFISGRGRALKALDRGMKIYIYPEYMLL